jgi:tetratricopeptide (TPR) repeat protein
MASIGGLFLFVLVGCGPNKPYPEYRPSALELEWDEYHRAELDGRTEEAEVGYNGMCSNDPPYPRACYDLSRMLFDVGRKEEARRASAVFIERFPDDGLAPSAAKRLARSYVEQQQWQEGISQLETLVVSCKDTDVHDSLLYQIAKMYSQSGNLEKDLEQV